MLTEKLYKGQIIKNYKQLCEILDWEVSSGNAKKSQFKELDRYCKWFKNGNKIIIDNIFDTPKDKIDNRINNGGNHNQGKFKEYKNLNVSKYKWNDIGIYYILKDNDIYIGSTIVGFRDRFQEHYQGHDKNMQHTYELLQNGATFSILYDMTGIEDEVLVRIVENEYINYFINYTDYNVINKREKAYSTQKKNESNDKSKLKNIKVPKDKYKQAIQLLIENGIIEDNITPTNNYILNGMVNDFDKKNMPF